VGDEVSADTEPEFFGQYRVEELLGRGGMGEVHRAFDTVNQRYVALKRLNGLAGEEFRARFRREARIVAELSEPHVVPIHAHGEIDGQLYLDMELIEGPDLRRLLADGPLEPVHAVRVLTDVAMALDAAHAAGVLHRDVKPGNILLGGVGSVDETAYLADFGIARSFAPDVTRLTATGDYLGTLDYMAPERLIRAGPHNAADNTVGAASDVYSLACVLFECLTGRVPFPAADEVGKLAAQLNDPPPAPSLFDRRVPSAMDLVVRTGMDKDPRRRYPTAKELMAAAAAVVSGVRASTSVAHPPHGADPGQTYFVRLLATVSGRQATAAPPTTEPPTEGGAERCPYPGLRSFGAGDAEWFFGREQAVRDLLARLAGQRGDSGPLLVVGVSGAGKSSLLHAGLLAAHTRAVPSAPRLAMTPGERPIGTLAARLAALTGSNPTELAQRLWVRPGEFGELCRAAVANSDAPLVIAVDQAEELFTQCRDVRERAAFATALASAWPARVVLAVRADFVESCLTLAPLKRSFAAPCVLSPLTAGELAEVITKPAEAAGLILEPGLVDRLITDAGAGVGTDPGALPRLAHALRETWHHRSGNVLTLKGYQQTGGVDRAVALTADGVYHRLDEFDRRALRGALLRMVTLLDGGVGGGGIARGRAHRTELAPRVLERLVEARLVTVDRDHVWLAHDALLTAWPRLREWVAEDRQGMLILQQLRAAAAAWEASGQDRGELYRGARLAAALDWSATRPDITPAEWGFLKASERDRKRQTRRLRDLVTGLAILLVLALGAGLIAMVARNDAEQQRGTAERERNVALSRQLAAESLAEADTDPVSAQRKAVQAWRTSPTLEARGALLSAPSLAYPSTFTSGVGTAYSIDVSPDGTLVAIGGADGEAVLWDVEANKPRDVDIAASGGVMIVRFSPDGAMLAVSSIDPDSLEGGVAIWAVPSGRRVTRLRDSGPAFGLMAWRPDGKAVAATSIRSDGTVWVGEWDPVTGKLIRWVADRGETVISLAYGTAGDRLAVGHTDGSVELWEPAGPTTGRRIMSSYAHRDTAANADSIPVKVAMSADLLATATVSDSTIRCWDPRTGALVREISDTAQDPGETEHGPSSLAFSANGRVLYTNSDVGAVSVWDPRSGAYLGTIPQGPDNGGSSTAPVIAIAVSRDGRTTLAADTDGTVRRWEHNPAYFTALAGSITGLAFHPDGQRVTAGDDEGALATWEVESGEQVGGPEQIAGGVFAVRYTKDGTRYTASRTATFTMTPPRNGDARTVTLTGRGFDGDMAVSPDGRWLAAAHSPAGTTALGEDDRITIWDARTLTKHAELNLPTGQWVHELTFSRDGDTLRAIVGTDAATDAHRPGENVSDMLTWQVPAFNGVKRHKLGADSVVTAVFTLDGRRLLTGGTSGRIEIRDTATGKVYGEFGSHPSTIRQITLSPDGHTIATITEDDTLIRLWNLDNHKLLAILNGHDAPINEIEFSPDGTRLASGGSDTDIGLWYIHPDDAANQLCANLHNAHVPNLNNIC
jgi:WD40 repeat protein